MLAAGGGAVEAPQLYVASGAAGVPVIAGKAPGAETEGDADQPRSAIGSQGSPAVSSPMKFDAAAVTLGLFSGIDLLHPYQSPAAARTRQIHHREEASCVYTERR